MPLQPGDKLGPYEILSPIGAGGMGEVYRAHDPRLNRDVAIKVSAAHFNERFEREAHAIAALNHPNICQVYDIGPNYLVMEFIEGTPLAGPLPLDVALRHALQIADALSAAHAKGITHRDLKPANILVTGSGIKLLDFGLALLTPEGSGRERASDETATIGMTQAGTILGTAAYMSPEQAEAKRVDARSDIFSFGLVLYEMLSGRRAFTGDSAIAIMAAILHKEPEPLDTSPTLQSILDRCLRKLPAERFQSMVQVKNALLATNSGVGLPGESKAKKWISLAVAAAVVLTAGGYGLDRWLTRPSAPVAPMTVIIADFSNGTGDTVFSGTLEPTLKLAMEGASFISAYDRTKMRDLGLKAVSGTLDESAAQSIAVSQGLNVVVSGSLDRRGTAYQLSLRAIQAITGKVIARADETASGKDQILSAVIKLAAVLRKALGDVSTSESAQRLSMETLSSANLEAVHEYAAGLDTLSAGKFADAQAHLSRALDLDPNFGMAYTIMASAARNQGRFQDAEQYIREAIKRTGRMTERERYRTRAYLYFLTGDYQKCVEEYGTLLERYSADTGAYTNIAVCLLHLHNVAKALELARRAVAILPKRAVYHSNLAMDLAYTSDFEGAAKEAAETVKLGYVNGFLIQAFVSLGKEQTAPAVEAYHNLAKALPSDAATGLADLAVYEGRYSAAVEILENGVNQDLAGRPPDKDAAATKYWMLAHVQLLRKQNAVALAAAKLALDNNKAFQTRLVAGQVYAALGEEVKARDLAAGLASELQVEPQAYAKLIEGEIDLKNGDSHGAIKLFTEANNLLDTWIGRFDLGRAYLKAGAFTEADSEFDRCIKHRGEALSLFLDLSTYGYFPPVYYYQGRAREGMKTAGFADSYEKYLSIRGKAGEDPLLAEVRRRTGK